ncbi:MAG TPA: tetratricopeptide repeat protein [Gaiellaceae bacterium]|nr:tetratricopeptide repeat protein [Gaiellaceae bacterium]
MSSIRDSRSPSVAAGERALGPRIFAEGAGYFWGLVETRPYMRARAALAALLWKLGRREEALEHARELLRLNPNDNQGIRYQQAKWLL